jgi:hypothetical protein
VAGRPPTLWCDLMVADGPLYEIDSITSGYSVPYPAQTRTSTGVRFRSQGHSWHEAPRTWSR